MPVTTTTKKISAPLLLVALLLLAACSRRPDMVLGTERMARLVADLELADAFATDQRLGTFDDDSTRLDYRRAILAKHGVNEAVLDSSFHWYGEHLPEYVKVIERADSILGDSLRALDLEEQTALAAAAGDSASIWPLAPSAVFARNQPSDFLTFEVPVDSTWQRGDVVMLGFSLHNAQSSVDATLAVDYANRGRTTDAIYATAYPGDVTRLELKLQLDSNLSATRIFGYMRMTPLPGERAFVDSIRLVRTRVVEEEYNQLRRVQRRLRRYDY